MKRYICVMLVILLAFSVPAGILNAGPEESVPEIVPEQQNTAPAEELFEEAQPEESVEPFVVGDAEEDPADPVPEIEETKAEFDTLEEVNEALSLALPHTDAFGGTEESYAIVNDEIGEITFTLKGIPGVIRASRSLEKNITGSTNGQPGVDEDGIPVNYSYCGEEINLCQFVYDSVQYALILRDGNTLAQDEFEAIRNDFACALYSASLPEELWNCSGLYCDTVVKRSLLNLTPRDPEHIGLYLMWITEDGNVVYAESTLLYDNGKLTYDELTFTGMGEGEELSVPVGSGWFEMQDGLLLWSGASGEPYCRAVFKRLGPRDVLQQTEAGELIAVDRSEYGF